MTDSKKPSTLSSIWWKTLTKETYIQLSSKVDMSTALRVLHDHELLTRLFDVPTVTSEKSISIEDTEPTPPQTCKVHERPQSSFQNQPDGVTQRIIIGLGFTACNTWRVVPRSSVPSKKDTKSEKGQNGDLVDLDCVPDEGSEAFCLHEISTVRGQRSVSSLLNVQHSRDVSMKVRVLARAMEMVREDPNVRFTDLVVGARRWVEVMYGALYTVVY